MILPLFLAIGGCADKEPARPAADVPVIIYVVDTLRADQLGLYGHPRPTSPNIDALAAESVVFDQAYAAAPWTLPSVVSLITSTSTTTLPPRSGRRCSVGISSSSRCCSGEKS